MSSIPFPLQFDLLDPWYPPSLSLDSGWVSDTDTDSDSDDSDMGHDSLESSQVSLFCNSPFDLNVKAPQFDLNVEPSQLDLNVERRFTDDFDRWDFDNSNIYDEIPTFMGDVASGLGVDSDSHEARPSGLRVARIDSDSDSEIIDMDISDDNLNVFESSLFPDHELLANAVEEEQLDLSVNESENQIIAMDNVEELSLSSSSISSLGEEEFREGPISDLEWELILSFNNRIDSMMDSFIFDADYILLDELVMSNDAEWSGRLPAAKIVVENLPLVDLRKEDSIVCAICKDEVEEGEMVNSLPCSHYYHRECIVPWFRIKNTCPVCRYELPTDDQDCDSSSSR